MMIMMKFVTFYAQITVIMLVSLYIHSNTAAEIIFISLYIILFTVCCLRTVLLLTLYLYASLFTCTCRCVLSVILCNKRI